ncbi:MAG: cell division protein ZapE, partial [Pseudomonadota bacterium]|nr:cell division protein ZapE [Pseudomonadota bacterium]
MHSRSPQQSYRQDLEQGLIVHDAAQEAAVAELQRVHDDLLRKWSERSRWRRLKEALRVSKPVVVQGLYLWGGVGRGKTWLMDLFFQSLPNERKLRMHFHRFMLMVNKRLNAEKGRSDPLIHVANGIAADVDVICFDEFFVSDIGDAMILANLLEALFEAGVALIATSNIEPEGLYEDGLQRRKFLPAIELIRRHCRVMNVDGGIDYRLRSLNKAPVFHFPLGDASERALSDLFAELTRGLHVEQAKELEIEERRFVARAWSEGLVWFDFEVLCGGPRSAADYIELSRQYHTVLVSGVPIFREHNDDKARRFIALVDEFYDHGVKLVLSAAADL